MQAGLLKVTVLTLYIYYGNFLSVLVLRLDSKPTVCSKIQSHTSEIEISISGLISFPVTTEELMYPGMSAKVFACCKDLKVLAINKRMELCRQV